MFGLRFIYENEIMIHVVIRKPRKVNIFMTGVKLSNIDVEPEIDSFWSKLMATLSASLPVPIAWHAIDIADLLCLLSRLHFDLVVLSIKLILRHFKNVFLRRFYCKLDGTIVFVD